MPLLLALLLTFGVSAVPVAAQVPVSLSERLGDVRAKYEGRSLPEAAALAESVRVDADAAADGLVAAQASKLLGRIRLEQDRFADARAALERARAGFRAAGDRRQELETELLLARTMDYQGDPAGAVARLGPVLDELETLDLPREAMVALYSQAMHVARRDRAYDGIMARALALLTPADRFAGACSIWQSAGDHHFNDADYVRAHEYLTQALACYEHVGRRADAGRVLVSLGRVQRAHGQLRTAMDYYVRAADAQKAEGDIPAWLQSLNAQAVTYDRLGEYARAEALYRSALAVARERQLARYEVFLQGNLGGSLLMSGRIRAALRELEAVVTREMTPEIRSIRHRQIAAAYTELGRLETARRHLETGRALVPIQTFDEQVTWLNQRAAVLARQGSLDAAQRDLAEAVRLIEDARARVLSGDTTRRGYGDLHQETFAASIDVAMRKREAGAALDLAEQARARALLDLMSARASEAAAPPLRVAEMQALAARLETTLVVYWVDRAATFAWVVTPGAVHGQRLPVGERQLRQWIRAAAGAGDVPGAINAALLGGPTLGPWRSLHRALVTPLVPLLPARAGARVTIVPHGPLLHLPFAGLLDARGRYLIERYTLHYAPSVAVLDAASRRGDASVPARALVLGDPAPLPHLAGVQLPPPLPHARAEARSVAGRFPTGATLSVGGAATEGMLRSQLAGYTWLHVATHARVAEETTAPSYLLLARGDGSAGDDGLLTAEEVMSLPLDGATVVLSACGTALGRVTGEGTLGFTRSFLAAGARAIVATTWEMPDTVGLRVMEAFYAARGRGLGVSGALRAAQLQQLRALRAGRATMQVGARAVPLPGSPLLWAGYVAVGMP